MKETDEYVCFGDKVFIWNTTYLEDSQITLLDIIKHILLKCKPFLSTYFEI